MHKDHPNVLLGVNKQIVNIVNDAGMA